MLILRVCSTPGCGQVYTHRRNLHRWGDDAAPDLETNCPACQGAQSRYRAYAAATRAVERAHERERGVPPKNTRPDPFWQRRFR